MRTLAPVALALLTACGQVEHDPQALTEPAAIECTTPLPSITLAPGECLVATDDSGTESDPVSYYDGCRVHTGVALLARAGATPLVVSTQGGRVELYAPGDAMCEGVSVGAELF